MSSSTLQETLFLKPAKPWFKWRVDWPTPNFGPVLIKVPKKTELALENSLEQGIGRYVFVASRPNPLLLPAPDLYSNIADRLDVRGEGERYSFMDLTRWSKMRGKAGGSWRQIYLTQPPTQYVGLVYRHGVLACCRDQGAQRPQDGGFLEAGSEPTFEPQDAGTVYGRHLYVGHVCAEAGRRGCGVNRCQGVRMRREGAEYTGSARLWMVVFFLLAQ